MPTAGGQPASKISRAVGSLIASGRNRRRGAGVSGWATGTATAASTGAAISSFIAKSSFRIGATVMAVFLVV